jgi:hypothetical protein
MEEENKSLKDRLIKSEIEREACEAKIRKLNDENNGYKEKLELFNKEKLIIQQNYELKIRQLELEFERLRFSSDHMMSSFRHTLLARKEHDVDLTSSIIQVVQKANESILSSTNYMGLPETNLNTIGSKGVEAHTRVSSANLRPQFCSADNRSHS